MLQIVKTMVKNGSEPRVPLNHVKLLRVGSHGLCSILQVQDKRPQTMLYVLLSSVFRKYLGAAKSELERGPRGPGHVEPCPGLAVLRDMGHLSPSGGVRAPHRLAALGTGQHYRQVLHRRHARPLQPAAHVHVYVALYRTQDILVSRS